jgi:hypothetical protein
VRTCNQEHPGEEWGLFPMENSKQFREFAEECGRLAQRASTEEQRRVLTKLAAAWSKIAEEYARGDLTLVG